MLCLRSGLYQVAAPQGVCFLWTGFGPVDVAACLQELFGFIYSIGNERKNNILKSCMSI